VDQRAFTLDHPELVEVDRRGREVTFHAGDRTQQFIDAGLIAQIVLVSAKQSGGVAGPNRDEENTKAARTILTAMQGQPHLARCALTSARSHIPLDPSDQIMHIHRPVGLELERVVPFGVLDHLPIG
jgi:hypothetical protein